MKIIVDADACPRSVLQQVITVGKKHSIPIITVSSFNHNIVSSEHITVGDGPEEADLKIINITAAGDIVITQDWGLAAMVLSKKASAVSPIGIEYSDERIVFLLDERSIKAKIRRSGGRTKGPKKRTLKDDVRFKNKLEQMVFKKLGADRDASSPESSS